MQLDDRATGEVSPELSTRFYDRVGPGTPAGQYLRRFRTPVALLDDVKPARSRTVQIMGELFTYYRGEGGSPHLVANECAHRHTRLAPNGIVSDDCISCFYHGWKYDAGGRLDGGTARGQRVR
jgi:5,5'-dehydrodivanillate O-demethylase